MTHNQIQRTAFASVPRTAFWPFHNPADYVQDWNTTCPFCKSQHTEPVSDSVVLAQHREFYGDTKHKVLQCSCSATFSVYRAAEPATEKEE